MAVETPRDRIEDVLVFWFGRGNTESIERRKQWWSKSAAFDQEISTRFGALSASAARGELDDWLESPRSLLAFVLLTDQFPRHIHRGHPDSFSADARALGATLKALDLAWDQRLGWFERWFLLMPLQHSEDISVQNRGVREFERLAKEAPEDLKRELAQGWDFAIRHRDIVRRFGRFPHRNEILGRVSSGEEIEFLKTPGSSF